MSRKNGNSLLTSAKINKNDEFYTQLSDIEKELIHYKKHFNNKIILCNCDHPLLSNFVKYFLHNFEELNLKKLIVTYYNINEKSHSLEYNGGNINNIKIKYLKENGDFRNKESIEFLKQADIVVTNPPFSFFRNYVTQLIEYDKKFLIIGNINIITYKDIFKLIKDNKAWLGVNFGRDISGFIVPQHYKLYGTEMHINDKNQTIISANNCLWFTNINYDERNNKYLILNKKYSPQYYLKYDEYDAINIDKTKDIPMDYNGLMGVPITFLNKFNPNQFEIIDLLKKYSVINGIKKYARIIIKNKMI